jgi:hypothetical protein
MKFRDWVYKTHFPGIAQHLPKPRYYIGLGTLWTKVVYGAVKRYVGISLLSMPLLLILAYLWSSFLSLIYKHFIRASVNKMFIRKWLRCQIKLVSIAVKVSALRNVHTGHVSGSFERRNEPRGSADRGGGVFLLDIRLLAELLQEISVKVALAVHLVSSCWFANVNRRWLRRRI